MSDPNTLWGCCDISVESNDNDRVKCGACGTLFHVLCLQPTNAKEAALLRSNNNNWKCPLCSGVKSVRNDNTPVRADTSKNTTSRSKKRIALSSPLQSVETTVSGEEFREIIREELSFMMEESLSRMNTSMCTLLTTELKDVKSEVQSLKDSIEFLSTQYEDVMVKYKSATEIITELKHQKEGSELRIKDLSQKINTLEQNARASNVEIQCLPESKSENLVEMIQKLNKTVGVDVKDEHILHCTRIAKKNRDSPRPRSVIIQFNTPLTRDRVLAAVTKFNKSKKPSEKLNSSHVGYPGEHRSIYIMEHLSSFNKELHAAARIRAKEKGYSFIWIRNGRIFVRKDTNSEYHLIRDLDSLKSII